MKKRVIIAALVCGFLGSSYASSNFQKGQEEDPFNRFRSPQAERTMSSGRTFNQRSRTRRVENRFSSTRSTSPLASSGQGRYQVSKDPAPPTNQVIEENFVINHNTGQKIYLDRSKSSPSTYRSDHSQSPPILSETNQYRDGSAYRSQSQRMEQPSLPQSTQGREWKPQHSNHAPRLLEGERSDSYGARNDATQHAVDVRPSQATLAQDSRWNNPQGANAPAPTQSRHWGQRGVRPSRGGFEEEVFGAQAKLPKPQASKPLQRRGPRVRKNVRPVRPVRRRRSWISSPFRKLGRMFTGLFRW
jgi:hypothetical protein